MKRVLYVDAHLSANGEPLVISDPDPEAEYHYYPDDGPPPLEWFDLWGECARYFDGGCCEYCGEPGRHGLLGHEDCKD